MSSEKILKKSALGGFKKESVLNYVEELQNEILSLKKELNNKTASETEIKRISEEIAEYKSLNLALKEENVVLKADNENLSAENSSLLNELEAVKKNAADFEEKIAVYEEKFASIEKKFSEIEATYSNKTRELDTKASVMMNDAVKYSENLIAKANETTRTNIVKTDNAIINALNIVTNEAEKIKAAHLSYNSSADVLENSISSLSDSLLKISENLKITREAGAK